MLYNYLQMKKKQIPHTTEEEIADRLVHNTPWSTIKKELHVGYDRISRVSSFSKSNNGIAPEPLSIGRPKIMDEHIFNYIETETLNKPTAGSGHLAFQILNDFNIKISSSTISKIRNLLKFRYRKPRTTQNLTENQIHNRMNFCLTNLTNEIDWSSDVIISDESRFAIGEDSRRRWIRRGVYLENTFCKKNKFRKSIMVWACIGKNYKSPLIFIEGNLNSKGYIEMLHENEIFSNIKNEFDTSKVYFQQDGATCHTAKSSIDYIKQNMNLIENWPSNSPDLSPIENLWGIIKHVLQEKDISSIEELKNLLIDEWNKLDIALINSLIESIPDRMELCLEQQGKQIGHLLYKLKPPKCDLPNKQKTLPPASRLFGEPKENTSTDQICQGECIFQNASTVFRFVPRNFEYVGKYIVSVFRNCEMNTLIIRSLSNNFSFSQDRISSTNAPILHSQGGVQIVAKTCIGKLEILYLKFPNINIATKFHNAMMQSITEQFEKENSETETNE
jgi:transposase